MPFPNNANEMLRYQLTPYYERLMRDGGEWAQDRSQLSNESITMPSGTVKFRFFTAIRSETITRIRTIAGGTAAAATPTLCKVGVYEVDPQTDNLSNLVASANTTSLWSVVNGANTTTLAANFNKRAGQRYAAAALCITAGATPVLQGGPPLGLFNGSEGLQHPVVNAVLAAQADLPATVAYASLGQGAFLDMAVGFAFLP
jgi:hypothetical protein